MSEIIVSNLFFFGLVKLFLMFCFHYFYFNKKEEEEQEDISQNKQIENKQEQPKTINYVDKYLEKWKSMETLDIPSEVLDTFTNKIIIEYTPLGNVLMYWDNKRGSFTYYSNHAIPYKFLETVARKYVIQNNCKKIYIDMEEEIKKAEKKLEENRIKEETKLVENKNSVVEKRNVFAKLKSYNKDIVKPNKVLSDSKNPSQVQGQVNTKSDKKYILKDNSNRYSYEGKITNFQFLKKVDKSLLDKNYNMTFSEFKKLQLGK
jgi:hypothetical protein